MTGSSISNIDGLLRSNASANLFLLNPNGIIFGPNASLDIGGSFVGTTANGIQFGEQGFFSASAPDALPLLTVNPSALLFNQIAVGSIENNSTAPAGLDPSGSFDTFGLRVPNGRSLLLVGGNVSLNSGGIVAFGGRVDLGGMAGAGTVELNLDANNLSLSFPDNIPKADVSLTNGAGVIVAAGSGGSIAINARNIDVWGGSSLNAGIGGGLGAVGSQAGDITLDATGAVTVANGFIYNYVDSGAVGNAGNLTINAQQLSISDAGEIESYTLGTGSTGNLTVRASDVQLTGVAADGQSASSLRTSVYPKARGNGGDITIEAKRLSVSNGAQVSASTDGVGDAGNLTVRASDSVELRGEGSLGPGGLFAQVNVDLAGQQGAGKGGKLTIETRRLSVSDGSKVQVSTFGLGDSGDLLIRASEVEVFETARYSYFSTGIFAEVADPSPSATGIPGDAERAARGNGGDLTIEAERLSIRDGGLVSVSTQSEGNAGSLLVQASDSVEVVGKDADGFPSSLSAGVYSGATGRGGSLTVETGRLSVTKGAGVSASTFGQGDAGSIFVQANDSVSLASSGSGIFSQVGPGAVGNGGNIDIQTRSLTLVNGSQVNATVVRRYGGLLGGQGEGGNIRVNATESVTISGVDSDGFSSGLFTLTDRGAIGQAGDITVNTGALQVQDGAAANAQTLNPSDGGNIYINANTFEATGGGQVLTVTRDSGRAGGIFLNVTDSVTISGSDPNYADRLDRLARDVVLSEGSASGLFANADSNSIGQGGDLRITTGQLNVQDGAQVTVSSEGLGDAGNLEATARSIRLDNQGKLTANTTAGQGNVILNSQDLVLRRGSDITTNANGTATGGNITIDTDIIAALENSDISANAEQASGGRVIINAQGIFGTEFRNQRTPESDITASSRLGPQFSGIVEINTPDIDPSQGLVELPVELVDASNRIAPSCAAVAENKFTIVGRGGLPPNPIEPLSGSVVLTNLAILDPEVSTRSGAAPSTNPTRERAPTQIVEATRWVINDKGEVVLTATAPTATPHGPWMTPANCHAAKTGSVRTQFNVINFTY